MKPEITLKIESPRGNHTIHVAHSHLGDRLTDLLRRAHFPLNTRCGQHGHCDGCLLELLDGQLFHISSNTSVHANGQGISLRGCEYRLASSSSVRIPARSLLAYEPLVVSNFRINIPRAHDPLWQRMEISAHKMFAEGEPAAALCRLIAEQRKTRHPVRLEQQAELQLPALAHTGKLHVTMEYLGDQWVVTDVSDRPQPPRLGVAIDIGTTTVALLLVDLADGTILSQSAMFNQQMNLGDDVVTRITLCTNDKRMLRELQQAVVHRTILPLLNEAVNRSGMPEVKIAAASVVGNTTMLHLFAGVDPSSMGVSPFSPAFLDHRLCPTERILAEPGTPAPATPMAASSKFHLLPGSAAYVGADLTAGALASGLIYDDGPSLLVDIGTNGEIILKHGNKLLGTATAAGPAFEGAGLSSGIRAGDGAISGIHLAADPFRLQTEVIGDAASIKPIGLCGSAYIDFLAEAKRIGLIGPTGRFQRDAVPGAAAHLIPWANNTDTAFRIANGLGTCDLVISQSDIGHLLPAKAAIAAGILILLKNAHLTPEQIKTVYLAGGFGTHMNCANAIACGLLPGFRPDQIQPVGNTALAGAYLALLDSSAIDEIARIGKAIEIVELNLDPDFEGQFIDQLSLP